MGRVLLVLVLLLAGYLLLWPVPIAPVAWTPPSAPSTSEGPFAANQRLQSVEVLAAGVGIGPEDARWA